METFFQTETVATQPYDAFVGKNLPTDTMIGTYMDHRSKNGTKGYIVQEDLWRAILPTWTVEDGVIKDVALYPIDLAQKGTRSQRGTPKLSGSTSTLEHIKRLSEPYGTVIEIRDGVGYVKIT